MFDRDKLKTIVGNFSQQKILVIGDLMLDQYLWCSVERLSPEAPVPIANLESEEFHLGGAGNVANNLLSLGTQVTLCGAIGQDSEGDALLRISTANHLDIKGIIAEKNRPTTVKTRVFSGNQQLLRIDKETTQKIKPVTEKRIWEFLSGQINSNWSLEFP